MVSDQNDYIVIILQRIWLDSIFLIHFRLHFSGPENELRPPQPEPSCSASPHVLKGRLKKYRFNRRGGVNQKAYQCIHCSFDFPFR